jgi:hypothetical protein
MRHGERGQVLPLWVGAIITTMMFAFMAINYGNTLRYQIRAQNAADSFAQGVMSLQAERYNALMVALYGTSVEEYRMRHLLQSILLAANDSGGCQDNWSYYNFSTGVSAEGTCAAVYADTSQEYFAALTRFTNDIKLVNDYSNDTQWTNFVNDTASLKKHLNANCNQASYQGTQVHPDGDDCAFTPTYTIVSQEYRTGLKAVQEDAQNILVPSLAHNSTIANDQENQALFDPGQVDVTTCIQIPPVIGNFGPMHMQPQYAIGRAAATNVMVEQDWMQPGALYDPIRPVDTFFQPYEVYTNFLASSSSTSGDTNETYNWYGVNFGGNAAVAYVNYDDFNQPTYNDEFSVKLGWWNAIAMKPFAGAPSVSTACTGASKT